MDHFVSFDFLLFSMCRTHCINLEQGKFAENSLLGLILRFLEWYKTASKTWTLFWTMFCFSWETLPFRYHSNPIQINGEELVIAIESCKLLIKYNISTKTWTSMGSYGHEKLDKTTKCSIKINFKNTNIIAWKFVNKSTINLQTAEQSGGIKELTHIYSPFLHSNMHQ